jgi:hypothetical protein
MQSQLFVDFGRKIFCIEGKIQPDLRFIIFTGTIGELGDEVLRISSFGKCFA